MYFHIFAALIFGLFFHEAGASWLQFSAPKYRSKREAVGTLNIVTNNAKPIQTNVKLENQPSDIVVAPDAITVPHTAATGAGDPCPKSAVESRPSAIEPGVGFKVTAPVATPAHEVLSRRKLQPFTNKLDIIRTITRLTVLIIVIIAGSIEFYPLLMYIAHHVYSLVVNV